MSGFYEQAVKALGGLDNPTDGKED